MQTRLYRGKELAEVSVQFDDFAEALLQVAADATESLLLVRDDDALAVRPV